MYEANLYVDVYNCKQEAGEKQDIKKPNWISQLRSSGVRRIIIIIFIMNHHSTLTKQTEGNSCMNSGTPGDREVARPCTTNQVLRVTKSDLRVSLLPFPNTHS